MSRRTPIARALAASLLAAVVAGCASRDGGADPQTDVRAYLRSLPPDERRQAQLQIEAMAAQQAAGFVMRQGIPLATVDIGSPRRVKDGWVYPVWRRDDPSAETTVHVFESSEVRADDLTPLYPVPLDPSDADAPAALVDHRFDPVQVERNTGVADSTGPFDQQ